MATIKEFALTTFDNPFNPFDDYRSWLAFDIEKGYNSDQYLARIAKTSDSLSDFENAEEIERAIDEIIRLDPFNIYKKVSREIEVDDKKQSKDTQV